MIKHTRPQVWVFALAALSLAACAPSTGATTAPAPTVTVIATSAPTPAAPSAPAPGTIVTVTAPPPVTVTVAPPAPPAPPAPAAPVGHITASGPFQTPSGNIRCTMFAYDSGRRSARCAVTSHDWVATQPSDCHQNWGDQVEVDQGYPAVVGCYGQDVPASTHTLEYGQIQSLGPLSCDSETVGITCTDNDTGHYFFVARETYRLG
jgi:hypothetical protein